MIERSLMRIKQALVLHKNPVVACSFGKDSVVTLHLVRRVKPDIPVVFNNTKVEQPETLQLKRQLVEEWKLNLAEVFPLDGWSFWHVVEKYGFPVGARRGAEATGKCCYYLKKAPMKKAMREHGWDLIIDGMTIYESRQRYLNIGSTDDGYRYVKGWGVHKLSPIYDWRPEDVWEYIDKFQLAYNRYYDYEMPEDPRMTKLGKWESGYCRCLRVGCWACTIPLKYNPYFLTHLRTFHPKLHKLLLQKGLGEYLLKHGKGTELYERIGADWIVENRPCYFDGVTV